MTRSFRLPHPDRPHETTTFLVAPRHLQTTPRYDQQTFYGTRQHYIAIRRLPDVCDATIHALPALRNRQPTTSHEPRLHKLHSTRLRYLAKPDTMRFAIFSFLVALLATLVMAAAPHRSVIISWPKDTPDEIVEQSKEAIRQAKGVITHEYNIIKGFAAQAPASALEMVSTLSDVYKCEIEEDGIVTTQNDKVGI